MTGYNYLHDFFRKPFESLSNTIAIRSQRPTFYFRYGLTIISLLIALAIRNLLYPFLGSQASFLIFIVPVIISALLGGLGAGLLATIIGAILGIVLFAEPKVTIENISKEHIDDAVLMTIFIVSGILISVLAEAVQYTNRQVVNILESITDAFMALDSKWNITYVNKMAERFIGRKRKDILHKNLLTEFSRVKKTAFYAKYLQAMRTGKVVRFEDFYPPHNKWYDVRIFPLKGGLSIYWQDITRRKLLENKKDEFVNIASHELKNPITTIKIFSQLLQKQFEKRKDTKAQYFTKNIETQTDKIIALIDDLLDVGKIEADKLALNLKVFSFDLLAKKVIIDFQYTTDKHEILRVGETNKKVYADEYRIEQVITNFLTNAIKYSPNDTKITVLLKAKRNEVQLGVRDFGIGIPKDKQDKIFKKFYQVDQQRESKPNGFGLGLYISADIIKRHRGRIWVESEPGKGSTFYFTLPVYKASSNPRKKKL